MLTSLLSCQKSEVFDTIDIDDNTKIGFSLLDTQKLIRGTAREGDDLAVYNTGKVNVFVYSYDDTKLWSSINTGEYSFYFRSRLNDLNNDLKNAAWGYAPDEPQTRFYPQSKRVSCFAYASDLAPIGAAVNENGLSISNPAFGVPIITYTVPIDVAKQPDLIVSERITDRSSGKITLPMKHALTRIGISMLGKGQKVSDVSITGVANQGSLSLDINGIIDWNLSEVTYDREYKFGLVKSYIIFSDEPFNPLRSDGYLMMLPQRMTDKVKLNFLLNDQPVSVSLDDATFPHWEAGKKITYLIDVSQDNPIVSVDFGGNVLSNCYIINPSLTSKQELKIPITRVNQFWGDTGYDQSKNSNNRIGPNDQWTVSILWYDALDLVSLPGGKGVQLGKATGIGGNDYFTVVVPAGFKLKGNLVVGIGKGDTGPVLVNGGTTGENGDLLLDAQAKCLWSWHIWITDYDPYVENLNITTVPSGKYATVPGGLLWQGVKQSFEQLNTWVRGIVGSPYLSKGNDIWVNNRRMLMDRPIGVRDRHFECISVYRGTTTPAAGESLTEQNTTLYNGNGVMYYQFGRKDPFPADIQLYTIKNGLVNTLVTYNDRGNGSNTQRWVWYTVYNPLQLIFTGDKPNIENGGGNWAKDEYARTDAGKDDILWADPQTVANPTAKSLFDPSPWLFRVPRTGAYNSFVTNYAYYVGTTSDKNPNNPEDINMPRNKISNPSYMEYVLTDEVRIRFWSWGSRFWKTGLWNDAQGYNGQYWMSATVEGQQGWDYYLLISPQETNDPPLFPLKNIETSPSLPSTLSGQTNPVRMNPLSPGIRASTMPLIPIQNQLPSDPGVSLEPWGYNNQW